MTVSLHPVTRQNLRAVCALQPRPDQRGFVAPNAVSIAETTVEQAWTALAIYRDDTPAGFALYGPDPDTGEWWLIRYMIDAAHQGQGIGSAALPLVLERMRAAGATGISLGVVPGNDQAIRLYRRAGFVETGEVEDGELVMRLAPAGGDAGPASGPAITLDPVTRSNIDAVLRLAFTPDQTGFVAVPAKAIAQSYVHRDWIPLAIREGGVPVGYAQYVVAGDDGRSWVLRIMIDGQHQNRGIGSRALRLLLDRMRAEGAGAIHLACDPRNAVALRMYETFGFLQTDEKIEDWDEIVLVLPAAGATTA
ncbi:MAG: GNAT family N-acetyltransferase [Chloroflexota bacterium]